MADIDNDWHECINIEHLHVMKIKANISCFFSNGILSFNMVVASLYLLGDNVIHNFLTRNDNHTIRQFSIKMQFPFEIQQSPIFEFMAITVFLHTMIQVLIIATVNGLIFTLVTYIAHLLYFLFFVVFRYITIYIFVYIDYINL